MKPTEFWSWSLVRPEGRGRYVMKGKYTEAMALSYWPTKDPQKVRGSVEIRVLPDSPDEVLADTPGAWRNNPATAPHKAK